MIRKPTAVDGMEYIFDTGSTGRCEGLHLAGPPAVEFAVDGGSSQRIGDREVCRFWGLVCVEEECISLSAEDGRDPTVVVTCDRV